MQLYNSEILCVAKDIFNRVHFLKTNMSNFRQPIRIHLEETETFPLTWDGGTGWLWLVTCSAFLVAARMASRHAPLFPFQLLLQGRLWCGWCIHFIMMSDIMELTSAISEQASASGAKHLREDKLITTLRAKAWTIPQVAGARLNLFCVHQGACTQENLRYDGHQASFECGTSQKAFGKFGKEGSSTNAGSWAGGQGLGCTGGCSQLGMECMGLAMSLDSKTERDLINTGPDDHAWWTKRKEGFEGARAWLTGLPAVWEKVNTTWLVVLSNEVVKIKLNPVTRGFKECV